MKKYGLPYQGSKSKIAPDIVAALPSAKNLYDLFAGGCAITHCAIESGNWKNVYTNDLQDAPQLFLDAVAGKYKNERRWISREHFHAEKMADPYIRWVWSFGNNGRSYLFGRDIEPLKKAAHEYLIKHGYDGTKEKRTALIRQFKEDKKIQRRFELEQLVVSQRDYRKIKIHKDSAVYCDIPYCHKPGQKEKYYGVEFDSGAFYAWARDCVHPVYFSSVYAPDDFTVVMEKTQQCRMNNKISLGKKEIVERLFWNGK